MSYYLEIYYTEANRGPEKFLRKLMGKKEIEDALTRLDKLTQEEALMAAAQILNLTRAVDNKVTVVGSKMDVFMKGRPCMLASHSP